MSERRNEAWEREHRMRLATLAKDAGLDTDRCEFCGGDLDATKEPWRRGLDGMGAHERCIRIHVP